MRNKAERLEAAAIIAPVVRAAGERSKRRRVVVVKHETIFADVPEVVGVSTLAEAQKGLLKAHEIEVAVEEGKRPKELLCLICNTLIETKVFGPVPSTCFEHAGRALCVCGLPKTRASKQCLDCRRQKKKKACVACGASFCPGEKQQRFCSVNCSAKRKIHPETLRKRGEAISKAKKKRPLKERKAIARRAWETRHGKQGKKTDEAKREANRERSKLWRAVKAAAAKDAA